MIDHLKRIEERFDIRMIYHDLEWLDGIPTISFQFIKDGVTQNASVKLGRDRYYNCINRYFGTKHSRHNK